MQCASKGLRQIPSIYTALVSAYEKCIQPEWASEVRLAMRQEGVLIEQARVLHFIPASYEGYLQVLNLHFFPNASLYCFSKQYQFFRKMQRRGLELDVITFSAVISACEKGN